MSDTLTVEQALAILPDDIELHVFNQRMVGAAWSRDAVVDLISNSMCRMAGPTDTELANHELAVYDGRWWFVQTKPKGE